MNAEYAAYLISPQWQAKRQKRLALSGHRCSACADARAVHVHHLTYARIFNENMTDLMPLCETHHKLAEYLIKHGQLSRVGDVRTLAARTLRLLAAHAPLLRRAKQRGAKTKSRCRTRTRRTQRARANIPFGRLVHY